MKSSIRSKLFLLVYALVLAFIAGLIILNNSFLENYYIRNRETSLVEAFYYVKDIDIDAIDSDDDYQKIEYNYNIKVQVLKQVSAFETNYIWDDFDNPPIVFERVYGNSHNISDAIISKIIYDFNQQLLGTELSYASEVKQLNSLGYTAYLMDIKPTYSAENQESNMIGLCVYSEQSDGSDIYYVLTVSFQSITDSIKIFNSFTIIVGFLFMILAFIVMFFISYSFTNPILQIHKVAEDISNLDFTNRLDIKSDDELGDLGESINRMSIQLESNIKELQKSNDRLAKEILHKNEVDAMRKEFIANASHELKTPLSMIMGYTEALRLPDLDNEVKEDYINIILDESAKMNKLVVDLLKLSQAETKMQTIELKDFMIKDLINDSINLFSLKFKDLGVKLEVNTVDRLVNSDYNQLQTVITNFLSNAINHLDDKKVIRVKAELLNNNNVKVSVFNTGNNIPEEEIQHIWESFYKVDKARTRSYGGQGLGLAICRTTLDTLGYDYGVNNIEDGVEFYFEIYLV